MESIILKVFEYGTTAGVAIVAFWTIQRVFSGKKINENNKNGSTNNHPLCREIIELQAIFSGHEKLQTETMASIHNGLNSNANAIKDITNALNENTKQIAVLTAVIEERLPKK